MAETIHIIRTRISVEKVIKILVEAKAIPSELKHATGIWIRAEDKSYFIKRKFNIFFEQESLE